MPGSGYARWRTTQGRWPMIVGRRGDHPARSYRKKEGCRVLQDVDVDREVVLALPNTNCTVPGATQRNRVFRHRCGETVLVGNFPIVHRSRVRSEEHTSELQSLMRTSYAVFGLKTKKDTHIPHN